MATNAPALSPLSGQFKKAGDGFVRASVEENEEKAEFMALAGVERRLAHDKKHSKINKMLIKEAEDQEEIAGEAYEAGAASKK